MQKLPSDFLPGVGRISPRKSGSRTTCKKYLAPRARFELATLRLTAEAVEILNALSCVAYRETRPIFSPSVGLLGLPAIDSVTPATKLDWEIGVGPKTRALTPQ